MSVSKRFLLDANVFIEAKNRYYGFDICPGFWPALVEQNKAKRVFSIDRIEAELIAQDDEIKDWIKQHTPDTFFKKTADQAVIAQFQNLMKWVYSQAQFSNAAKSQFASVADGWIVAYAAVNGLVVVTHEQYAPDTERRVPIPNVCIEFDVDYVNTFDMLRDLGEKFVRSTRRSQRGVN